MTSALRRRKLLMAVAENSVLIALAIAFLAPLLFIVATALMTNQQALSPDLVPNPLAWNFDDVFNRAPLLRYAGSASGRSEDDLAYWRDEHEFRSAHLFEQPNGDFAHTIVRQFAVSHYLFELYARLRASADPVLAASD